MSANLINFVVFQCGWLLTVFAAARGLPLAGVIFTLCWMALHLGLIRKRRSAEIKLLLFAAASGYLLDSMLVVIGLVAFPERAMLGGPTTLWMVTLWINLAATLNYSLSWLKGRYVLAGLMAAIAGPLSYLAGDNIGAISIAGQTGLFAIALLWMVSLPALLAFTAFVKSGETLANSNPCRRQPSL